MCISLSTAHLSHRNTLSLLHIHTNWKENMTFVIQSTVTRTSSCRFKINPPNTHPISTRCTSFTAMLGLKVPSNLLTFLVKQPKSAVNEGCGYRSNSPETENLRDRSIFHKCLLTVVFIVAITPKHWDRWEKHTRNSYANHVDIRRADITSTSM